MSVPEKVLFAIDDPAEVLVMATRCQDVGDAVAWLAEGRLLQPDVSRQQAIAALATLDDGVPGRDDALRRLVRSVATSDLDTAAVLFGLDGITRPDVYRRALDELARQSPTKTLDGMTPFSVLHAQQANPHAMVTLCALASLSYRDAQDRVSANLPGAPDGEWTLETVRAILDLVDAVIDGDGAVDVDLPGAAAMRPIEHMFVSKDAPQGWERIESFRSEGVPLEMLLAQREVGGSWVTHRSSTSTVPARALADRLCQELDGRGLLYVRARSVGGEVSSSEISTLVGGSRSVGLVVLGPDSSPRAAIAFSVARDGGTARKNAGRLKDLAATSVPVAFVLAGPGWKDRNETAELARAFGGGLYTDQDLDTLAKDLANLITHPSNSSGD